MLGLVVLPARVFVEAAILDQPDAVGQALDEGAVVTDHHEGSAEVLQGHFQRLDHFHVEVVGGFVQNEEVVVFLRQFQQGQAGAFPAAQDAGGFVVLVVGEHEGAEQVVSLGIFLHVLAGHVVERLVRFYAAQGLVVVPGGDPGPGQDAPAGVVAGVEAQQGTQQGGLPRPVAPDDGDPFAAPELHVHVLEQRALSDAAGDVAGVQHHLAALGSVKVDAGGAFLGGRGAGRAGLHPVHAGLHGPGAAGQFAHAQAPDFHAVGAGLQAGDLFTFGGETGGLLFQFGVQRFAEYRVISSVDAQLTVAHVRGFVGDVVQEGPVVTDDQHRAGVVVQETFQPLDHDDVQVVGGFVQ